ncbi:conserved hypothetical protein [gamma proteobacterium HdN1]|nr:conserved hypothetical protein [gamma proteobacterium HdN1]
MNTPFFQVPRTGVSTSEGDVDLPILYYDATAVYAFFLVNTANVDRLLAGTGLVSALRVGQRSLVAVACYEYRNTTVGVYNEVGIAAATARHGESLTLGGWPDMLRTISRPEVRQHGMYVLDLPVTTPKANAAGREIWGLPKFVTPIPFRLDGRDFTCQVDDPNGGSPIMCLDGQMGLSVPAMPFSLTLFSRHQGHMLRTIVNARGKSWLAAPGSVRLQVGDSSHPMAQRLRELGLDNAKPVALLGTTQFQSRLNGGCAV